MYFIFVDNSIDRRDFDYYLYKLKQSGYESNVFYSVPNCSILDSVHDRGVSCISEFFGPRTLLLEFSIRDEVLLNTNTERACEISTGRNFQLNSVTVDDVFILTNPKAIKVFGAADTTVNICKQVTSALETLQIHEVGRIIFL